MDSVTVQDLEKALMYRFETADAIVELSDKRISVNLSSHLFKGLKIAMRFHEVKKFLKEKYPQVMEGRQFDAQLVVDSV